MELQQFHYDLEPRSCSNCGSEFKVMPHSDHKWCSEYCKHEDKRNSKWSIWHKDDADSLREKKKELRVKFDGKGNILNEKENSDN